MKHVESGACLQHTTLAKVACSRVKCGAPEGLLVRLGRRLLQSALLPSLPLLLHDGALLRQLLRDPLRQVRADAKRSAGLHAGVESEVLVGLGLCVVAAGNTVAPFLLCELDLPRGELTGREGATLALVVAEEQLDQPARSFVKSDSSVRHLELADAHPCTWCAIPSACRRAP